jgi:hypothetical protein
MKVSTNNRGFVSMDRATVCFLSSIHLHHDIASARATQILKLFPLLRRFSALSSLFVLFHSAVSLNHSTRIN